jgi:hypothetical protein
MSTNCRARCALTKVTLHVEHLAAAAHREAFKLQPIACITQRCCLYNANYANAHYTAAVRRSDTSHPANYYALALAVKLFFNNGKNLK